MQTQTRAETEIRTNEWGLTGYLMHADVALVAEDHLVAVLSLRRAADVTHHVLVVLDAEAFLRLDGLLHFLGARALQLHQHALHGQLVQLG